MFVLIPLGGLGIRFKKNGYSLPKPLVNVMGKPIIYWLLDNLNLNLSIDFILIPYNNELAKFRFEAVLQNNYPKLNFKFIKLTNDTRGAAETIYISLSSLDISIQDSPVLCLDGDNFYLDDIIKLWNGDNCIFSFYDNNNSENAPYSYIKFDKNMVIRDIKEKKKISNNACTGAYGFNSWKKLQTYCKNVIDNGIMDKNEFYTSVVVNEMIKSEIDFYARTIDEKNYICLGTPFQVRLFCNNFPKYNSNDNKWYKNIIETRYAPGGNGVIEAHQNFLISVAKISNL